MSTAHFDIASLVLYVLIAISGSLLIKAANNNKSVKIPYIRSGEFLYYTILFVVFVVFAVFRKVDANVGGTDAPAYIYNFENIFNTGTRYEYQEQLFLVFIKAVRYLTDEYKVYFLICYSLIAYSYIYFLKNFLPDKAVSYIPFILLLYPYLKSFNTLRSSLAIAIFLIALVCLLKKKNVLGTLLIFSTFFIHRMSILYIVFVPFYFLFRKQVCGYGRRKLLLFLIFFILASYLCARFLQHFIIAFQLLYSDTDAYYLTKSIETGILTRWPMLLPHFLLLVFLLSFQNKLPKNGKADFLKILCIFDIIIMPVSVVLGMWRANEYFYVARLITWGVLIELFSNLFSKSSKIIVKLVVFAAFLTWLIFRICSEWQELKIMPYLLDIV